MALLFDPVCQEHNTGHHPENRERIESIRHELAKSGLIKRLALLPSRPATPADVAAVHDTDYVRQVEAIAQRGGWLDWDTVISPGSYRAALAAAGCTIQAVDAVMGGQASAAFALCRPPGHHARPARGMGFCLFNNIAIAAHHALAHWGIERVLIADFDAHHGNGTQEAFYSDNRVLFFSSHLSPFYPGTGDVHETGSGAGIGYTVNVPLPAGTDDDAFLRVYTEVLSPLADRFRPQLVLVSAGYDIHWADPLTELGISIAGLAHVVLLLQEIANRHCPGRLAMTLEGGYYHPALAAGVAATLHVLLGDRSVADPLGPHHSSGPDISEVLADVKRIHGLSA